MSSAAPDDDSAEERRLDVAVSFAHHKMLAQQIAELSVLRSKDNKRMTAIEEELKANTATTTATAATADRIDKATAGIVSMFNTLESGLKVMGWIGNAGQWLLKLGAAAGGAYAVWLGIKAWMMGGPKP